MVDLGAFLRKQRQRKKASARIDLLRGGDEFFPALIQSIEQAETEVLIETYIFEPDAVGNQVAHALMRAAQRGVRVCLTLDGFGSGKLPPDFSKRLRDAGIELEFYRPVRWYHMLLLSNWRRLHRKLVVVDQRIAYCGGINIIDDYFDGHIGKLERPRLDYAVRIEGSMAEIIYAQMLQRLIHDPALDPPPLVASAPQVAPVIAQLHQKIKQKLVRTLNPAPLPPDTLVPSADTGAVHASVPGASQATQASPAAARNLHETQAILVLRDNLRHRRRIEEKYIQAIRNAKSEITIANAYFIPGYRMLKVLRQAAQRGVKVTLLLQGMYEHFFQHHTSRAIHSQLLRQGIHVSLYHASHLHGKVAVIDRHWATVGSSNLDPFSLLLAREANIIVEDARFARTLQSAIETAIAEGGQVLSTEHLQQRSWLQRFYDFFAYGLMRLLVLLSGQWL